MSWQLSKKGMPRHFISVLKVIILSVTLSGEVYKGEVELLISMLQNIYIFLGG